MEESSYEESSGGLLKFLGQKDKEEVDPEQQAIDRAHQRVAGGLTPLQAMQQGAISATGPESDPVRPKAKPEAKPKRFGNW